MSDLSHPAPPRRMSARPSNLQGLGLPLVIVLALTTLVGATTQGLSGPSTLTQGLGLGAVVAMASALVLASRWRWLDALMGGPDRSYRAHRWFGYGAVITLGLHWAMEPNLRLPETGLGELAGGRNGPDHSEGRAIPLRSRGVENLDPRGLAGPRRRTARA
ncbi:hypothetical protein [Aliiroseovarius sp.]|uniref:hypothetical protein n=1 Tax=Aliiroseovarius sp. TaxID=1872442 RepID=UPI003BA89115